MYNSTAFINDIIFRHWLIATMSRIIPLVIIILAAVAVAKNQQKISQMMYQDYMSKVQNQQPTMENGSSQPSAEMQSTIEEQPSMESISSPTAPLPPESE